jgi:hypothetical protein
MERPPLIAFDPLSPLYGVETAENGRSPFWPDAAR